MQSTSWRSQWWNVLVWAITNANLDVQRKWKSTIIINGKIIILKFLSNIHHKHTNSFTVKRKQLRFFLHLVISSSTLKLLSYSLMSFVANQEAERLFINCIIDLFTKHIENLGCVRHYYCAEDSQTNQTAHPPIPQRDSRRQTNKQVILEKCTRIWKTSTRHVPEDKSELLRKRRGRTFWASLEKGLCIIWW